MLGKGRKAKDNIQTCENGVADIGENVSYDENTENFSYDETASDFACGEAVNSSICAQSMDSSENIENADSSVCDETATDSAVPDGAISNTKNIKYYSPNAAKRRKKSNVKPVPIKANRSEVITKEQAKASKLSKVSAVWTLISTAYAIVSTCLFISRDWVSSTVSYVLIAMLSVYIAIFIGLVVFVVRDPKRGVRTTKTYKRLLGIFKTSINIVFLSLTAVSMAGMAANDMSVGKWFVFVLSFVVAVVQLGLKIGLLISRMITRHIAKKYKVRIQNYRDGKRKKNNVLDVMAERKYKDKD